jgi:hypothetical protein
MQSSDRRGSAGDADKLEPPFLSDLDRFQLLAFLDKGDMFNVIGQPFVAELMLLAVQTYLDIANLTTVESIAAHPRVAGDLQTEIVAARWALVSALLPNEPPTTSYTEEVW